MSLIVFGVAFGCIETGSGRIYILSGNSMGSLVLYKLFMDKIPIVSSWSA